jgi:PAS domain S-box-containing protein
MSTTDNHEILIKKIAQLEEKLSLLTARKGDLKVNEQFIESLCEVIPSPLFYKDSNFIYRHCNNAFADIILGIEKEQVIGKSVYCLPSQIPSEHADVYYSKDNELLKSAGQQSYESNVKCADGIERYYHFYKSAFVVNNETVGMIGLMLDVSKYQNTITELDKITPALNRFQQSQVV